MHTIQFIHIKIQCYIEKTYDGVNTKLGEFEPNELDQAVEFANKMRQKYYGSFKGKDDIIN